MREWLEKLIRGIVGPSRKPPQAAAPGRAAEDFAARYLEAHAARILARNVRCRGGEIDLVIDDAGSIAFVEVRLRSGTAHGGAAGSITARKQARLVIAAQHWLGREGRPYRHRPCRFDALLLSGLSETRTEWLKGAFEMR